MAVWEEHYFSESANRREGKTQFQYFNDYFELNKNSKITIKEFKQILDERYYKALTLNDSDLVPKKPPTYQTLQRYAVWFRWNWRIKEYQKYLREKHDKETERVFDTAINTEVKALKNKQNEILTIEQQLRYSKQRIDFQNYNLENEDDLDKLKSILEADRLILELKSEIQQQMILWNYRGAKPESINFNGTVEQKKVLKFTDEELRDAINDNYD